MGNMKDGRLIPMILALTAGKMKKNFGAGNAGKILQVGVDGVVVPVAGSGSTDGNAVHYTADAGKTDSEKLAARQNIGAGTYSKPDGGIPSSDMTSAVQTSLGKADSALQSVPNTYRTAAAQDVIDAAKQDKINDLSTIRSGAAAGATALQPNDASTVFVATQPTTTYAEIETAYNAGREVICRGSDGQVYTLMRISYGKAYFYSYHPSNSNMFVLARDANGWYGPDYNNFAFETALAGAYSASASYAVGDYCTRMRRLYKCVSAISGGEEWTAEHWTEVCVTDEMGGGSYVLPVASASTLGGVKVGGNLSIDGNGVLSVTGAQMVSNLVTSVSSSSTDSQYPSAKLLYDTVGNIESALNAIRGVS